MLTIEYVHAEDVEFSIEDNVPYLQAFIQDGEDVVARCVVYDKAKMDALFENDPQQ